MNDSLEAGGEAGQRIVPLGGLTTNLAHVIRGKSAEIRQLVISVLAGGHVLIEDVPGVGKTTLARALAISIGGEFRRIQFTPDLLPTDILGGSIYSPSTGTFTTRRGPIFANVVLADEINRASPRTQSALLEAMSEGTVSLDGESHQLPDPFLVIATQNPIEFQGTYPLPEAQLDRFMTRIDLGYPPFDDEVGMLFAQQLEQPIISIAPVSSSAEILELRRRVREVRFSETLARYVTSLVVATRDDPRTELGASPRGSLCLFRAAQAAALLEGRDHVLPEDIQEMAIPVLAHRISLETRARYAGVARAEIVQVALETVPVPV